MNLNPEALKETCMLIAYALVDSANAVETFIIENSKVPNAEQLENLVSSVFSDSIPTSVLNLKQVKLDKVVNNRLHILIDLEVLDSFGHQADSASQLEYLLPNASSVTNNNGLFIIYYNCYSTLPIRNDLPVNLDLVDRVISCYRVDDVTALRIFLTDNSNVICPLLSIARQLNVPKQHMPWLVVREDLYTEDCTLFMEFLLDLKPEEWALMDDFMLDKLLIPYTKELEGKLVIST